jgi:putative tricarboxylic transport membrane protein
MRIHDGHIGGALLALSLMVLWHVQGFPDMPGQAHGPALFPGLAAFGLAVSSLLLIGQHWRRARLAPAPAGAAAPGNRVAVAVTIIGLFAYWLLVDRIGFLMAASALLIALLSAYRVRPRLAVPIALMATLLVHSAFFKLLKVPLPWGLLAPVAW